MSARWPFRASRVATLALTCSASSGESRLIRVQAHHLEGGTHQNTHTKTHTEKKSEQENRLSVCAQGCFTHASWQSTLFSIEAFFCFFLTGFKPKRNKQEDVGDERRWRGKAKKKKINAQRELWAQGNKCKCLQTDASGREITPEAKPFLGTDLLLDQEI